MYINNKPKDYSLIDLLKFLSAVTIIAIHTQPFLGYTNSWLYPFYGFLKCFAIPFFFVSSAYLFFSRIDFSDFGGKNSRAYLKKWCKRLLQLYLVYSAVNACLMLGGILNMQVSDWIRFILIGTGNGYLWFFAALLEAVLLIYVLVCAAQKLTWGGRMYQ